MNASVISVPYDSGLRGIRMGAGPEHLMAAGLPDLLVRNGHTVRTEVIEHEREPPAEIRTGFELMGKVAKCVHSACASGCFPIVLSGNCNLAVGTIAGLGAGVGVVWLDAHPDFQTPDMTRSGFLDATGLATATGRCWQALAQSVPGFKPVEESGVVLIGVRDFQDEERTALEASGINVVPPQLNRERDALFKSLDGMSLRAERAYLHIDLDVLDTSFGIANEFASEGGLSPSDITDVAQEVSRRLPIGAIGIASFDPSFDPNGSMAATALELILNVANLASAGGV